MTPPAFAWRSLTRQPARAFLGIAGIAVVGALLFDMLLLSSGLAVSFRDLLDGTGYDVRVTAGQFVPSRGPMIRGASRTQAVLGELPEIDEIVPLRFGRAEIDDPAGESILVADFLGVGGSPRGSWTVVEGEDLDSREATGPAVLINRTLADRLRVGVGDAVRLRGACERSGATRPTRTFEVAGIVTQRFDSGSNAVLATIDEQLRACEPEDPDAVTLFLVASRPGFGPDAAVASIERALPDLHAFTNQEFVDRLQVTDFSYFRQISFALSTITLLFAFLLIATLLTVSVNQRLGEVAALRALGFGRWRIVADLIWESALLVGTGSLLAVPLGWLLARRFDDILRQMPGIPVDLHFFVFQPRTAVAYVALITFTGTLAAVYPVYLAARLPIAATLRREVIS